MWKWRTGWERAGSELKLEVVGADATQGQDSGARGCFPLVTCLPTCPVPLFQLQHGDNLPAHFCKAHSCWYLNPNQGNFLDLQATQAEAAVTGERSTLPEVATQMKLEEVLL